MNDRELLEAAAKAAGYQHKWHHAGLSIDAACGVWNPLTDDGDALRLAVKLRIDVLLDAPWVDAPTIEAIANTGAETQPFAIEALDTGDPYAATRRAIVRAAAAMVE